MEPDRESAGVAKGRPVPNLTFETASGETVALWDFRQKAHLVILYDPNADAATAARLNEAVLGHQKLLDWLGAVALPVTVPTKGLSSGVTLVDRWGHLIDEWPWSDDDLWKRIEEEFVYYEARHC